MSEKTQNPSESKHSLEQRKLEAEIRLREAEIKLKRDELAAQIERDKKTKWSPATITLFVAVLGILGTLFTVVMQNRAGVNLEKQRLQSELILRAIETGNTEEAAKNLQFLIKAGLLQDETGAISAVFDEPEATPVLSAFCRKLTSISQSQVDSAPLFPDALRSFQKHVEEISGLKLSDLVLCSWGNYDREQLMEDCEYHKISYPFGPHRSLKHEFAERHHMRPMGMRRALRLSGIPFKGTKHRAFDDAWNLARLFRLEWGGVKLERRTTRTQFWTAVAVGSAVALLSSTTNVPGLMGFGVILGTFVAGAVANGARKGGPAAFLTVFFWGAIWLVALPLLGISTVASLEGGLPTSIAVVFAASIFGLLFGMLGGLLGKLVRCVARIFYFPIDQEKEISYVLRNASYVKLSVHNLLGQRIKTLVEGYQTAGHKSIKWDGTDEEGRPAVSGIYFYRMKTDESAEENRTWEKP